jgi:glycosyltransferase involved in cell wall biosynthesis
MILDGRMERNVRFLVFIPSSRGGIAISACHQCYELARRGHEVIALTNRELEIADVPNLRVIRFLQLVPGGLRGRLARGSALIATILINQLILTGVLLAARADVVLFDCLTELLAPLWAWPHLVISRTLGVRYALTVHDPERRSLLGPLWWHELSVRAAYAPFTVALVHGADRLKPGLIPEHVLVRDAPLGAFAVRGGASGGGLALRAELGIPSGAQVALAFGYIGDRKNLDVVIGGLARVPALHLLVAGQQASSRERPIEFYRQLARDFGVENRVHFVDRFIPEDQVGAFFDAADIIVLAYESGFVSQSGVLHVAANFEKPVVASAGPGPLLDTVARFDLGPIIEPGSREALAEAFERLMSKGHPREGWARFRAAASWRVNVDRLLEALAQSPAPLRSPLRQGSSGA